MVALVVAASLVVPAVSVVAQGGFSDLDEAGPHRAGIENLAEMGVLEGTLCAPGQFCPTGSLQRWVMAVWLVRVLDGADPVPSANRFADVDPDEWWAPYVERLAVLGVTTGCATGLARYCPTDSVTRAQMATFLTRALNRAALSVALESSTGRAVTGSFEVGVSFARPVTGFETGDLRVVNGRATGLAGSGSDYAVTIVPSAEGSVVVWIPQGAARDSAGTPNQASGLLVRVFGSGGYRDGPGFDVWDREAVVGAYRAEFEREQPDPGFTGSVADCDAGTTSQPFRDSVVQRVNWYRQMAGLDTVTEDPSRSAAAQRKALVMSAEGRLSHYPSTDWACHTEVPIGGGENLVLGAAGVSAVNIYMQDSGANNRAVGHRRQILSPSLEEIGTGDIYPETRRYRTANAMHFGYDYSGGATVREQRGFVAWPPAGYVPAGTTWGRWSFQLPEANFSDARVTVRDNHGPISVAVIDRNSSYGGAAIVWAVYGDTDSKSLPDPRDGDFCYVITISNVRIRGTVQTPYQYATCLLDLRESHHHSGLSNQTDLSIPPGELDDDDPGNGTQP